MLVNFSKKIVFIKTTKTASSSTELFLKMSGEGDQIFSPGKPGWLGRVFLPWDHMTPREVVLKMRGTNLEGFTWCANVRNPWDRMVSEFAWSNRYRGLSELSEKDIIRAFRLYVLRRVQAQKVNSQIGKMSRRGEVKVFRYENLTEELRDFAARFSMRSVAVPRDTATSRPKFTHDLGAMYDKRSVAKVGALFRDWNHLGYEPPAID